MANSCTRFCVTTWLIVFLSWKGSLVPSPTVAAFLFEEPHDWRWQRHRLLSTIVLHRLRKKPDLVIILSTSYSYCVQADVGALSRQQQKGFRDKNNKRCRRTTSAILPAELHSFVPSELSWNKRKRPPKPTIRPELYIRTEALSWCGSRDFFVFGLLLIPDSISSSFHPIQIHVDAN